MQRKIFFYWSDSLAHKLGGFFLRLSVSRLFIWKFWQSVQPGVITPSDTLYIIDKKRWKKWVFGYASVTVRKDEGIKIWCRKMCRGLNAELKQIWYFEPAETLHIERVREREKKARSGRDVREKKFLWEDLGLAQLLNNQLRAETNSRRRGVQRTRENEARSSRLQTNGRSTFAGLQQIESVWIFAEEYIIRAKPD